MVMIKRKFIVVNGHLIMPYLRLLLSNFAVSLRAERGNAGVIILPAVI